ncbi:sodium:solute symporter family transporter [Crenobacter intestini]|uniref:Cation acetate symporter n=1 Tax=Crenobacter intestini TaxID=2563443 RepID=A0A4T0UJB5_9NEIS|nr:cation acetate symporter [Crenobacter intestini]TIC78674.1 cation acetate symporter [Crenobacter intestini]
MSPALAFFIPFALATLALSHWAARKSSSGGAFFSGGGRVGSLLGGFALAGDYLSAAAFLGAAGLYYQAGYDSLAYAVGTLAGWPLMTQLVAGRMREEGVFGVGELLAKRFGSAAPRRLAAGVSLAISLFYLVVQLVGAGKLLGLLFGFDYTVAVLLVTLLSLAYVAGGGMLATTWVQAIKAVLLVGCALALAALTMARFDWQIAKLFDAAAAVRGDAVFLPSAALASPVELVSLGLGLTLGLLGLPHVLMRFYSAPDAARAQGAARVATLLIALVFSLNFIDGFGALALLPGHLAFFTDEGALKGGSNMAALHLAQLLGGPLLAGFVAAVAFATILAVVAGLTLSATATLTRELMPGRGLAFVRGSALALSLAAAAVSIAFQLQNIAVLLGFAFALAASANFPVLLLALYWKRLTARGAAATLSTGLAASLLLIVAGPGVWVAVLGFDAPLQPLANPALVSVPLAFAAAVLASRARQKETR